MHEPKARTKDEGARFRLLARKRGEENLAAAARGLPGAQRS